MYEKIAWDNFYKTGNIESFLEYKKIGELYNIQNNNDLNMMENVGENLGEFNQDERNSNKRGSV